MADQNQTTVREAAEIAHAALAGFWHPNNPAANADMEFRVRAAINKAILDERERCAGLVEEFIPECPNSVAILRIVADAIRGEP